MKSSHKEILKGCNLVEIAERRNVARQNMYSVPRGPQHHYRPEVFHVALHFEGHQVLVVLQDVNLPFIEIENVLHYISSFPTSDSCLHTGFSCY